MKELLEAKAVALAWVADTARREARLLPAVYSDAPVTSTGDPPTEQSKRSRARKRAATHYRSRLEARRRAALLATGTSAAIAVLTSRLTPFADSLGLPDVPIVAALALGLTLAFGLWAMVATASARIAEQAASDASDALEDPATLLDVLADIYIGKVPFTRVELETSIDHWSTPRGWREKFAQAIPRPLIAEEESLRSLANRIGARDFANLVIAIGEEADLIESSVVAHERWPNDDPRPRVVYRLIQLTSANR